MLSLESDYDGTMCNHWRVNAGNEPGVFWGTRESGSWISEKKFQSFEERIVLLIFSDGLNFLEKSNF